MESKMSSTTTYIGWSFSAAISVIFIIGAYAQFTFDSSAEISQGVGQFPVWFHLMTALSLLSAVVLYMIPQSSFATLGAIIMTGMLGGMMATLLLQGNPMWWTRAPMGLLPWWGSIYAVLSLVI